MQETIITSFPRSWGRDPHSVHKRIRMRLKTLLPGEIQTAYDLALVIVDQCSGVIFDRTRVMERQPPVIDMFQDAIGNIVSRENEKPGRSLLIFHSLTSKLLLPVTSGVMWQRRHVCSVHRTRLRLPLCTKSS